MGTSDTNQHVPRALAHFAAVGNPAVDAALVEALPTLGGKAQSAVLTLLAQRGHPESLASVVARFTGADPSLQELFIAQIRSLAPGVRLTAESPRPEERSSAFELIVRAQDAAHVFLLEDGLRSRCPQSCAAAARALLRLSETIHGWYAGGSEAGREMQQCLLAEEVTGALARGLATWDLHKRHEILRATMLLLDRLESVIRKHLTERRSPIAKAFARILESPRDPVFAGLALRGLALPGLESAAARAFERAQDATFIRAILGHGDLLADPHIKNGCRRIRSLPWLESDALVFNGLQEREVDAAVRLLTASGVRPQARTTLLRSWLHSRNDIVREVVVRHLIQEQTEDAMELLASCVGRLQGPLAERAAEEMRRRRMGERRAAASPRWSRPNEPSFPARRAFDRLLGSLDQLRPGEESALIELLRPLVDQLLPLITLRLAAVDPMDRFAALRIASRLGVIPRIPEKHYRLCHDADPRVRSLAIALLAELPGPTSGRILRAAVDDRDERVQANAIEATEHLDLEDRVRITEPKLRSPSSRVRANAIKSLVRAGSAAAGAALIDMLKGESVAHRRSALWVVDRLGLTQAKGLESKQSGRHCDPEVLRTATMVRGSCGTELSAGLDIPCARPAAREASNLGAPS